MAPAFVNRLAVVSCCMAIAGSATMGAAPLPPAVVVIVVDTLRMDRMGINGYPRDTSPAIDALLQRGARFSHAWTIEPLTAPAVASAFTGVEPHAHGATRNGLRIKPGLDSLPKLLVNEGWSTAAFVGNWTLKDHLTGLGEHFSTYQEVLTRRRWFGLFNGEAIAEDVTDAALDWLRATRASEPTRRLLIWVHYVEPHAPYRFHDRFASRLGLAGGRPQRAERYDTEIAAVDEEVGRLVSSVEESFAGDAAPLFVFVADHGESLGEHDEWGHGRELYEPGLRIPMGIVWPGQIPPSVIGGAVTILDLAPTLAGLLHLDGLADATGGDWSGLLRQGRGQVTPRAICIQAHKGAVQSRHESEQARSKGLLAVGVISGGRKEILSMGSSAHELFDLAADPLELSNLSSPDGLPSEALMTCVGEVMSGLGRLDTMVTRKLSPETIEQLKALGYLD